MSITEKHYLQIKNGEYLASIENGVLIYNRGEDPDNTCEIWELPHSIDGLRLLIKHYQEVINFLEK